MAGVTNPSFETVGANVGEAAGWTIVVTSAGGIIADFSGAAGTAPRLSVESFGTNWFSGSWLTEVVNGTSSVFDLGLAETPTFIESFGFWSQNQWWSPIITNTTAAQFGAGTIESFDPGGWSATITPSASFTESFDPGGWSATTVNHTAALFTQGTTPVESFGPHQADVVFVLKPGSTNTFQAINAQTYQPQTHYLPADFAVTVATSGVRPGGISQGLTYYIKAPSGADFQLATSAGGAAITVSDAGSGLHRLHANETLYWTH